MAKFFVGQRVRMIWSRAGLPEGMEGVITACQWTMGSHDNTHEVMWSAVGTRGAREDQLEPILPDGHRACDEDFKRDLDKLLEGVPA